MATLYDTLGVHEKATDEEIKRAYRKAAMRWHPDRNAGHEDAARAAFQEIRDAYAILSDRGQREVYDAIFAAEMRRWEDEHQREEREREEREAAARAAAEAVYAERVALAMRFATQGLNRDVVVGVLLGHECEASVARQIAESAVALHESRIQAEREPEPDEMKPGEPEAKPASAPFGSFWYQFLNGLRA